MSAAKTNRKVHRVGAILCALPALVILVTGLVLQLKKDWSWVQPPTVSGDTPGLSIGWDEVLEAVAAVPEAEITTWDDVLRLDVRPNKGMLKVRCANGWEVQLDAHSGAVLSSEPRRSDWIESLHDGSWFHDSVKLWIFLPTAVLLLVLWGTGIYLWWLPYAVRRQRSKVSA